MSTTIAVIGECMLELSHQSGKKEVGRTLDTVLSYGGDTLNTAVYLARLGVQVEYVTALGDDHMSTWMINQWSDEGVGCKLINRYPDRVPGMYMIETDTEGERTFLYWRSHSPARELFDDSSDAESLFAALSVYPWIYLSGITLALYSNTALQRLFSFITDYRAAGGRIVFDSNCRPALWPNNEVARLIYETMYAMTDIVLSTLSDEILLFGNESPEANMDRLRSYGIDEIALKMGDLGALVSTPSGDQRVAAHKVTVVDTTAAGDSFNAGYLAARLADKNTVDAALAGHRLASHVIQHRGAIIDPDAMLSLNNKPQL